MKNGDICIIGGGPAGLMAAETLSGAGCHVTVFDAMPTFGRKFLLAGKSGLNITHSEEFARFLTRYGASTTHLADAITAMTASEIRDWAAGLGTETFIGSSGRVFPTAMKASPLLRAWLRRLEAQGVVLKPRHRLTGLDGRQPVLVGPDGAIRPKPDAVLLALGGGSWPRLGSDGSWIGMLSSLGVPIHALQPANCGFDCDWSPDFAERFAGAAIKSVVATSDAGSTQGEFVISRHGIEGSLIYAHSAALRDRLVRDGQAHLVLDLAPGRTAERLARDLARQPAKASLSTRLKKGAGLDGVKSALVRQCADAATSTNPTALARAIKALSIPVLRPRPIAEAISTAGGIAWDGLDPHYMLKAVPGVFAAGEMIDWEAPTGGYLLTACLATGKAAAEGILGWLHSHPE